MEGGVGAFTQELAQALADLGHQIHIITSRQARPQTAERRLSTLLEPTDIGFAQLHPHIRRWRWPALAAVADIALRYELDVVNIQYQAADYDMRSPAANFWPWRLKGLTKTVVTFHDLRVPYLFPKAGFLRQTAVRFMARQAHGCITTNEADYQTLRATGHIALTQIPIGSNITAYQPNHIEIAEARDFLRLQAGDCLLGYFGFLHESKGADILLRALAQLEEHIHLVFIGGQTGSSDSDNNASFQAQIEQLIQQLGLAERVHWTGFLPDQRVSTFLHAADVMVLPYRDGVSLRRGTLMAVLAHGRPLITTHSATPTPLQSGHNALLIPPNDELALVEAVRNLLVGISLREGISEGAKQVAAAFTWDKIAAQTADLFQTLIAP
jgi:glycosyltransferase involved in cell wall biosynthesis